MQPHHKILPAVSVVHLIWLPFGIDLFKRFLASYKAHEAGYAHSLILLFNGVQDKQDTRSFEDHAEAEGIAYKAYYKETGQDIDAYYWLAAQLTDEYILFLNSYSQLLAAGWLNKYMQAMVTNQHAGIIGATGAYTSPYDKLLKEHTWKWEPDKSVHYHYRKYKLLIKTISLYRFYFKRFPNPHIRSTAFLMKRTVFLSIKKPVLRKKMDAYLFECGRNSMTIQLQKMKLQPLVLDKDGNSYKTADWAASRTFWIENQEKLLVSDNQTAIYANGSTGYRKQLTWLAWGKA